MPIPISQLVFGALFAAGIAYAAYRLLSLTRSGAGAAFVVGFVTFGLGGWTWALALLTFFATSSGLSRWRRDMKRQLAFEKTDRRDAGQVWANGGVATLCVLITSVHWVTRSLGYSLFLAALAAANADTWATEIGAGMRGRVYRITTFKTVAHGVSGGVTLMGTIAALLGAALIAFFALPIGRHAAVAIALAGWGGSLFDSLLGATVQAQWRDPADPNRWTEIPQEMPPAQGFRGVNNDVVNMLCIVFSVVLTFLLLR